MFLDEMGELCYHFEPSLCVEADLSVSRAFGLHVEMEPPELPRSSEERARRLTAASLPRAFEERKVGDTRDFFQTPRQYLATRRLEKYRVQYLGDAFGFGAVDRAGAAWTALSLRADRNAFS